MLRNLARQSDKKSLNISLSIEHIIPSINIFPYDMIYEYGDTIREYDALLLINMNMSKKSFGEIVLVEEVSYDIDNEVAKLIRDIKMWPPPIIWITDEKTRGFDEKIPLHLKTIQIPGLDRNRDFYRKIYELGYELYNLLFYTIIYSTINVPSFIINGYNNIASSPKNNIYIEYIKCYIEHFKTLLEYRRGGINTSNRLRKCIKKLYDNINTDKELKTIKEKLEDIIKKKGKTSIDIYIYPQLTHPYPEKVVKTAYYRNRDKQDKYISSRRIDKQVKIIKQFINTVKFFEDNINIEKIYLVASNWKTRLRDKYDIYIERFKEIPNIEIIEKYDKNKQIDTDHLSIVLIIYDYVKYVLIKHIKDLFETKNKSFIIIVVPENCYIPRVNKNTDKSRLVEIHSLPRKSKNIFRDPLYSQHIYFYYRGE